MNSFKILLINDSVGEFISKKIFDKVEPCDIIFFEDPIEALKYLGALENNIEIKVAEISLSPKLETSLVNALKRITDELSHSKVVVLSFSNISSSKKTYAVTKYLTANQLNNKIKQFFSKKGSVTKT